MVWTIAIVPPPCRERLPDHTPPPPTDPLPGLLLRSVVVVVVAIDL